jgi:hypothetical protein
MDTKLRLGHSVLAWDDRTDNPVKGKYIRYAEGSAYPHKVIREGSDSSTPYMNCILDPEATEFLSGDEVYCKELRRNVVYVGKHPIDNTLFPHVVLDEGMVVCVPECRYPAPEPKKPDQTEHKLAELIEKTAELMELLKKFGKSE